MTPGPENRPDICYLNGSKKVFEDTSWQPPAVQVLKAAKLDDQVAGIMVKLHVITIL